MDMVCTMPQKLRSQKAIQALMDIGVDSMKTSDLWHLWMWHMENHMMYIHLIANIITLIMNDYKKNVPEQTAYTPMLGRC